MDFGDILEKWNQVQDNERKKKKIQNPPHKKLCPPSNKKKKSPTPTTEENSGANPIDVWLNRYGTVDKDKISYEDTEKRRFKSKAYLAALKIDATLDLHGLTRDEAWSRLESFVTECAFKKLKKILIIHGKGLHTHDGNDPVLGDTVRLFIEQDKRLGTSGHPTSANGGSGATWVVFKAKA